MFNPLFLIASAALFWWGLSVAAGLTLAWTQSNLPIHLFEILRFTGWRKDAEDFWPAPGAMTDWTRLDFVTWSALKLPPLLADLINCPVCMSYHISFWTSAAMAAALSFFPIGGWQWLLIPAGTLGWPAHIKRMIK